MVERNLKEVSWPSIWPYLVFSEFTFQHVAPKKKKRRKTKRRKIASNYQLRFADDSTGTGVPLTFTWKINQGAPSAHCRNTQGSVCKRLSIYQLYISTVRIIYVLNIYSSTVWKARSAAPRPAQSNLFDLKYLRYFLDDIDFMVLNSGRSNDWSKLRWRESNSTLLLFELLLDRR